MNSVNQVETQFNLGDRAIGNLFGGAQVRTASSAADQNSALALQTVQQQNEQNLLQAQQQSEEEKLINSRTAALDAQVGQAAPQPFNLAPTATILNSELGDQADPQTTRNKLLGN